MGGCNPHCCTKTINIISPRYATPTTRGDATTSHNDHMIQPNTTIIQSESVNTPTGNDVTTSVNPTSEMHINQSSQYNKDIVTTTIHLTESDVTSVVDPLPTTQDMQLDHVTSSRHDNVTMTTTSLSVATPTVIITTVTTTLSGMQSVKYDIET